MSAIPLGHSLVAGSLALSLTTVPTSRYRPLQRRVREPFHPKDDATGRYRLPKSVRRALSLALAPFRSREAAYRLASFLGRFWSHPERLGRSYPCDRRALADHGALGLTEGEIRGALRVLEQIGFVTREPFEKRFAYRPTEEGLRRRPISFRFGPLFQAAFRVVNRWKEMRDRLPSKRPASNEPKESPHYPSEPKALFMGSIKRLGEGTVMGDPSSPLESALAALGRAILKT